MGLAAHLVAVVADGDIERVVPIVAAFDLLRGRLIRAHEGAVVACERTDAPGEGKGEGEGEGEGAGAERR